MKKAFIFFGVIIFSIAVLAQPPEIIWTSTYDSGLGTDDALYVKQTLDGGFIMAGYISEVPIPVFHSFIEKVDDLGELEWRLAYIDPVYSYLRCVEQTSNGDYIAVGNSYDGPFENSDIFLVFTDAEGIEMWTQYFGGDGYDVGFYVSQTEDGGFIIGGRSTSFGEGCMLAIKTDYDGNIQWMNNYGSGSDEFGSIAQTIDGGYIIAGSFHTYMEGDSIQLIKIDAIGNVEWEQAYPNGKVYDVKQTSDGGYIITGFQFQDYFDLDAILIKTDEDGELIWRCAFGGDEDDRGKGVLQTDEGGYLVLGNNESTFGSNHIWLIRTNENGDSLWTDFINPQVSNYGYCINPTFDCGYIISGRISGGNAYLVRLGEEGLIIEDKAEQNPAVCVFFSTSPNPFNASTVISYHLLNSSHVKLEIFDVCGRAQGLPLQDGYQSAGAHSVTWDAEGFSSGIYFVRLEVLPGAGTRQHEMVGKMLLVK